MQRSAQKIDTLFDISRKVVAAGDLQELLDFIVQKSVKVFRARSGSLMLIEPHTRRLVIKSVVGLPLDVVKTMKLQVGRGVTGQCALTGKPVLVRDTTRDPHYIEAVPGTLSELAVPLIAAGKIIGVLNLDSERLAGFTKQDMKLLFTFASWAAMAIVLKQND